MEVYENPQTQFVAGFIGSPAMNFLPGRIEGGGRVVLAHGGSVAGISVPTTAPVGAAVNVGIRPEHLDPGTPANAVVSGQVELVEHWRDMLIHFPRGCDCPRRFRRASAEVAARCISPRPGRYLF